MMGPLLAIEGLCKSFGSLVVSDNVTLDIDLQEKPVAMEKGLRFAVREGGRTVGSGVVTEIIE